MLATSGVIARSTLFPVAEVAKHLGVSRSTVYQLRERGELLTNAEATSRETSRSARSPIGASGHGCHRMSVEKLPLLELTPTAQRPPPGIAAMPARPLSPVPTFGLDTSDQDPPTPCSVSV